VPVLVDDVAVAQAEEGLHRARRAPARAHRLDHGRRAGDDVAAGVYTRDRRGQVLVGRDVAPRIELQLRGLADDRVRVGADRIHDHVRLDLELAARLRDRPPPPGLVGLAEHHPDAAHAPHVPVVVAEQLDRAHEPLELDALLLGVMDFLGAGRRLLAAATVQAVDLLGAESQAHPHRVHGRVAGADHRDATPRLQRGVVVREVAGLHQVAARQQLVGREHAVQVLARNAHEARIACTGTDEHRVETHLLDHLLDREQPPDERVALEADAEALELADLRIDDLVRKTEVRNPVLEHAAGLVEGLVHGHLAAGLGHVGGAGHSGRTRADDPDAERVALDVRDVGPALLDRDVADIALEATDCDRLERLTDRAHALALILLRADPPADRRQQVRVGDHVVGAAKVLVGNALDEVGDRDADRAAGHAGLLGAHQAALGLEQRVLDPVALVHFLEVPGPLGRLLLVSRGPGLRDHPDRLFFLLRRHQYPTPDASGRIACCHDPVVNPPRRRGQPPASCPGLRSLQFSLNRSLAWRSVAL
jgi:hypothetical protein